MSKFRAAARVLAILPFVLANAAMGAGVPAAGPPSATVVAVAFSPLPQPAYIEVKLRDDSPDNVRVAWEMHNALLQRGLLAKAGPTLRLTLDIDSAAMVGDAPAKPLKKGEASDGDLTRFMGILHATLVDAKSGQRLWEAEAVYSTTWGDVAGGAAKLVPVLAESMGKTVEQRSVTLP